MKKVFGLFICLCCIFSLTACQNSPKTYDIAPRTYVFGGSTSTGSFYVQSASVANIWENSEYVDSCSIEATTGSFENLMLVSEGAADFALAGSLAISSANSGTEPYTKIQGNLTAVCYGGLSVLHFIVKEESDIYSVEDMKGHSISTGTVGSGAEQEVRECLNVLGIKYDDFTRVDYVGIGDGLSSLKDGKVDIAICDAGVSNASITEACLADDLRIIEFAEEEIEAILSKCDWAERTTIEGGTYNGITEDVQTVCTYTILLANKNIPDEIMYNLTKSLYENMDSLRDSNSIFEQWSFTEDMTDLIAVHPGVRQYLNEVLPNG